MYRLLVGIVTGVYIAQTYNLPDIKEYIDKSIQLIKDYERDSRRR
jgi:hypothetical protein